MKKTFLILFLLTACGRVGYDYEPKLSSTPKDKLAYEADRKSCIKEATLRINSASEAHKNDELIPFFGMVGYSIAKSNSSPSDDYWRSPSNIVDECLSQKGYAVIISN